jgi:Mg2+ and Co2+ transporter CorA
VVPKSLLMMAIAISPFDLTRGRRFVWVHLILGNARARDWIGAQDVLPPEAREVFLSKDRHPSLHWGGEALWGTLHDVRHEDQMAGMEATDLRFALWPQFLLTARHHAARSAMAVRDQAEKGAIFEDSAALFESLLVAAADSMPIPTKPPVCNGMIAPRDSWMMPPPVTR